MTICTRHDNTRQWTRVVHAYVASTSNTSPDTPGEGTWCYDSSECAAGLYCGNEQCRDGSEGDFCDSDAQCQGGICQDHACQDGSPGDDCFATGDSACDGSYDIMCRNGTCAFAGDEGEYCDDDADCNQYLAPYCVAGECETGNEDSRCFNDGDCRSWSPFCVAGICWNGSPGDLCEYDSDCLSGECDSFGRCE
jgi:hypothetical protein